MSVDWVRFVDFLREEDKRSIFIAKGDPVKEIRYGNKELSQLTGQPTRIGQPSGNGIRLRRFYQALFDMQGHDAF